MSVMNPNRERNVAGNSLFSRPECVKGTISIQIPKYLEYSFQDYIVAKFCILIGFQYNIPAKTLQPFFLCYSHDKRIRIFWPIFLKRKLP